jgi:hypothetical protein
MLLVLGDQARWSEWSECIAAPSTTDQVGGDCPVVGHGFDVLRFGWLSGLLFLVPWLAIYGLGYAVVRLLRNLRKPRPNTSFERTREG